ncbi:MAG: sulfatase, partial [Muribaculaceae bacterium]|nr:sulfatase [Muribaculaceae bacterium]
ADDAGHMSAYGTKWLNTPNFDRVARQGIMFDNAFTCNSKSAPSRAAMITGRNSWQLKEAGNHWANFPTEFRSYPEALAKNGYQTGCTGKGWGPGVALKADGSTRNLTGKNWNKRKCTPPTDQISKIDYAANFDDFMAARDKSKPFCFWYGAREPHRKYEYGSSTRFGKSPADVDTVPAFWPDNDVVRTDMLDYAVEIEHFDTHLGRILESLEKAGELNNTLIIVTSDHGMPFPRIKGQEYYDSAHIPLAVMWADGLVNPGRRIKETISVIDFAPTILEAAGVSETQSGMQPITGRSFMDIIKDQTDKNIDRDFILIGKERHDVGRPDDEGYPIRGIIRGDYLYIPNYDPGRWPAGNPETGYMEIDGSPTKTEILKARRNPETAHLWQLSMGMRNAEELYNITTDPNCLNDLAANPDYDKIRTELAEEMTTRLKSEGDPRMEGHGDVFDKYPNMSAAKMYWNRTK